MVMFISLIVTGAVPGSVPTSLHRVSHHSLSVKATHKAGMGKQGDIVLEDNDTDKLYMYKYGGKGYLQKWERKLPDNLSRRFCKAVNSDGNLFLQNDTNEDTICYSNGLLKQYSANHKGDLINSIDGELFYLEEFKKFFKTKERIRVYNNNNHGPVSTSHKGTTQEGKPLTLLPPWKDSDYCFPSVSRVKQNYVVVEHYNNALDVFDPKGMFLLPLINYGERN